MPSEPKKTRYELTVELLKAVAWPVFAFFILFSFWRPLHSAMEQLPDIVSRSNTITIAGLSLKIDRSLQLQGQEPSAEVRQVLSRLTPDGIQTLLGSGQVAFPPESEASGRAHYAELVRLGLFEEIPTQELNQRGGNFAYGVRTTPLGKDTQKYLFAVIAEFVQQLNQLEPTPTP